MKYEKNPVMEPGHPGSWDDNFLLELCVIFDGMTYKMWYGGNDNSHLRIGYATSFDGIHWRKYEGNPVLDVGPPGSWDASTVTNPSVIFDGTTYKMWYQGVDDRTARIGYATSLDGVNWTKADNVNPVLEGDSISWEGRNAQTPVVLLIDTTYFMWYASYDGVKSRIGLATSSNGINWKKDKRNPVMGSGSRWDFKEVYPEAVIYDGELFQMWYIGLNLVLTSRTGYATSSDGVVWKKNLNPVLDLGPSGSWDEEHAAVGAVHFDGTIYHMWYESGDVNSLGAFGYATTMLPWWKTSWIYTIYGLFILVFFYGIWRFDVYRLKKRHALEMKLLEAERLKEMDEIKSRFFANISHEFRTPLTLIQGPIESMLSKETRAEEKKQYKMVLRNSHRLQKLVNQLLDLSRIETKQMKLHTTELDIVKTVREIAASFESLAFRNKINFSIDTPDDPIMGWFDQDCVEKIVTNLLANAFKFTSEGDQVILRLQTAIHGDQDSVEITVKDTGIGIPGDQIDKVFDRFYQVDASNMREQEGAGIGLALTKELVELHGGNITVTSEVGESTSFSIKLSAIEKDVTSEETALIEQPPDHRGLDTIEVDEPEKMESPEVRTRDSRHQILIIDDNADMRKYMGSHLETNYRIIEAENGQEGLKKAIKKIPDLIISDVMMPKMDGFTLCEKVKTDERSSHIPVILLTAKADSESKLGGLETGADDYLTKPFDPKELQVRIKNLIQQRRRLRQKFMLEASIKPHDLAITSTDEKFLQRAVDLIEEHMSDGKYSIDLFSREIGMSRMQLHRKLKALTGTSTSGFIRTLRMKHAALLLQQGFGNVAQVAFEVGFNNPSYFSVCFKKQLGKSPTDFIPD